tara:strand:+ start:3410 stop:3985 length:576 start_codon:yes stop_codon:yes gene_type:complete
MKNILKAILAGAIAYLMILEWFIIQDLNEVKEAVVETNEIVKEIQTTLHNTPYDLNNDYHCLASNIYWEARNQPLLGQLAVAQVTQNRVDNDRFPDSICSVVKQTKFYPSGNIDLHSCQFSWYCDGKSDEPLEHELRYYEDAFYLAVNFIEERPLDITEGATHYHNTKVNPNWASHLEKVVQIEEHIFYRQ